MKTALDNVSASLALNNNGAYVITAECDAFFDGKITWNKFAEIKQFRRNSFVALSWRLRFFRELLVGLLRTETFETRAHPFDHLWPAVLFATRYTVVIQRVWWLCYYSSYSFVIIIIIYRKLLHKVQQVCPSWGTDSPPLDNSGFLSHSGHREHPLVHGGYSAYYASKMLCIPSVVVKTSCNKTKTNSKTSKWHIKQVCIADNRTFVKFS